MWQAYLGFLAGYALSLYLWWGIGRGPSEMSATWSVLMGAIVVSAFFACYMIRRRMRNERQKLHAYLGRFPIARQQVFAIFAIAGTMTMALVTALCQSTRNSTWEQVCVLFVPAVGYTITHMVLLTVLHLHTRPAGKN